MCVRLCANVCKCVPMITNTIRQRRQRHLTRVHLHKFDNVYICCHIFAHFAHICAQLHIFAHIFTCLHILHAKTNDARDVSVISLGYNKCHWISSTLKKIWIFSIFGSLFSYFRFKFQTINICLLLVALLGKSCFLSLSSCSCMHWQSFP
jgi:hypothetical protein